MREWERLQQELEKQGKTADLQALADSPAGQRLGKMLDGKAVEQAAKSGDAAALRGIVQQVMATREGKDLAARLEKLMGR